MNPFTALAMISHRQLFRLLPMMSCLVFASGLLAVPSRIGDLDEDDRYTIRDVARIVNHIQQKEYLPRSLQPYADVNEDGTISRLDVDKLIAVILEKDSVETIPLARPLETSPANGEGSVSLTRETVVRFSLPLGNSVVLDHNTFYASFGGRKLLSRVEISSDRMKASLFYLENLPGSARIRVTLKGDSVLDSLGRIMDMDRNGVAGGDLVFDFDTASITPVPLTGVIGTVYASAAGGGSSNVPLQGVIIEIVGAEENSRTVTAANGTFRLQPVPAGRFFVNIDGRLVTGTYPNGDYYPFVGKTWEAVAGKTDNLANGTGQIFLPLVKAGALQPVSVTEQTPVSLPQDVLNEFPEMEGTELLVPPNSLFANNGTRGGRVGMAPVPPDRLPEPLPMGLALPMVITIQTDGATNFDVPVPVKLPNLPDPVTGKLLQPGEASALWSFDHDTGQWEIAGPMTVTPDGMFVVTDMGVGVRQPGWHGSSPGSSGGGGRPNTGEGEDDPNDLDGDGKPNGEDDDVDGDGKPNGEDDDVDGDGKPNGEDDDVDGDGKPNGEDDDVDGDGKPNGEDDDVDGDGSPNGEDDDVDGDGQPNGTDDDTDGDGVPNGEDGDVDGDGVPNGEDDDIDGDSVPNEQDDDMDGDGESNEEDSDDDGDGVGDNCDEVCWENGDLSNLGVTLNGPTTVCLGDTISFMANGAVDSGGSITEICRDEEGNVLSEKEKPDPAVTPTYDWVITHNGSVVAAGSGPTATVVTAAVGTYTAQFTATVKRKCLEKTVNLQTASANAVDRNNFATAGIAFEIPSPDPLIKKVEDAINRIPRVSIKLEPSAAFGLEFGERDCCQNGQVRTNGERYGQGSLSAGGSIDVQVWGPPTFDEEFDWGFFSATVLFEVGVFINTSVSAGFTAGKRIDECKPEECFYGEFKTAIEIVTQVRFKAIAFGQVAGYEYEFDDINFKVTAPLKVGVSGSVKYNSNDGCTGFAGSLGVDDIVFILSLELAGANLTFQKVAWESTLKI